MGNVHKLHTTKIVAPAYTARLRNAESVMNTLRDRMHGMHYRDLAEKVGVSASTIMAVRSGRTKWPRPNTFFSLLDVLHLDLMIVDRA